MARIMVIGYYSDPSTYVLYYLEDKDTLGGEPRGIFQVIKEGEPFFTGSQFKPWVPVRVKRRGRRGSVLVCRKYGDDGRVLDQFVLLHGQVGLWALTAGAARQGVFHRYIVPQSALELTLQMHGIPIKALDIVDDVSEITKKTMLQYGQIIKTDYKNYVIIFHKKTNGYNYVEKVFISLTADEDIVIKAIEALRTDK